MKKYSKIIVAIVAIISTFVLASCQLDKTPKIEFLKSYIEIALGDTIDLNDESLLKIENVEIKNVHFESSNKKAVFISPDNKMKTVGGGTATIVATAKDARATLSVNVLVPKQPFAKVSEIVYSPESAEVSWKPAFLIEDEKEIIATSYEVKVFRNNTEFTEFEKISNTAYKFLQGGTYTVSVKAIAPGFAPSEETTTTFTVLNTPTGLEFVKGSENTHQIKWNTVEGANFYELKVNDEAYIVAQNSYTLNLQNAGTYTIAVKAIKEERQHSVYTQEIEVVKLETPTLKLEEGVLKVVLSKQEKLDHFELTVKAYQTDLEELTFSSNTGQFDLSTLNPGNFVAQVRAVAGENNFVISSEVSAVLTFEKLNLPSISFDKQSKQISVNGAYQNTKLFIQNLLTQEIEQFDFTLDKFDFDKPYGEFALWAQNLATQENTLNSDNSTQIIVKVLGFTKDVSHTINQVNNVSKSVISFQKVLGATSYQITVDGVLQSAQVLSEVDNRISFVLDQGTDTIFDMPKDYEVEVVAVDSDYQHTLIYGQVSNNKTVVRRLDVASNVNLTLPVETVPITWESVEGATAYSYVLYKNDTLLSEGILQNTNFEVQNLVFGSYKLQIYTIGNQREYLSSLNFAELEFSKNKQLQSPVLSFDRETNNLIIEGVEDANEYEIYYTDLENLIATLTDTLSFDISSYLTEEKTHNFFVVAKNNQDNFDLGGNLISSQPSTLDITKLESVKRVVFESEQTFKYDNDLLLSVQQSTEFVMQVEIDGQVVNIENFDLSTLSKFELALTKIANVSPTNPYLISSDRFVVEFERLETVENLVFENWLISWNSVEGVSEYLVEISAQDFSTTISTVDNNLNLGEQTFKELLENGFNFTVKALTQEAYTENGQKQLLSSLLSQPCVVDVLEMPEIISVQETDTNKYEVVWTNMQNVSFVVDFEGDVQTINQNQTLIVVDENQTLHTLKVKAISPNHITSKENTLVFEKLDQVEKVYVYEGESFEVDYNLIEQSYILVNNNQIDIEDKTNILNPNALNGEVYEFAVVVAAPQFEGGTIYYINSKTSLFRFEKNTTPTNLKVEDGKVLWTENSFSNFYELVFEDNLGETLSIVLPAKDTEQNYVNHILLTDERIVEFINNETLEYTVKIKVKVSDFELLNQEKASIDSDFSPVVIVSKLETPKNVAVSAYDLTDKEQKILNISWDAVEWASYYNIFVNGNMILQNQIETSLQSDFFTFENSIIENGVPTGKFEVEIVAFGQTQIQSEPSQVLKFTRLAKVDGYKTTNDFGGLQWNANTLSENFVFYIENQIQQASDFVELTGVVSHNFADLLELDEYKEGTLKLYLLIEGDGAETFSSEFDALEVIRLDAPVFEISGNIIVVEESLIFEDASFELVVYFKQEGQTELIEVQKTSFTAGSVDLPNEWKYKDGSPILQNGSFVFEMVAKHSNYITSVKTIKENVKLDSVVIDGFRKVEDPVLTNETAFEFVLNVGNVAQTEEGQNPSLEIIITVKNNLDELVYVYVDKSAQNRQGTIVYDIEELFLAMKGNFEVEVKVSAVGYIDSKTQTITGTRLFENTSLSARMGVLTWARNLSSSASGYVLKVNYGSDDENQTEGTLIKQFSNIATVSDKLEGVSGSISANVKVVSNIQMNTLVKTNVVLDSFYMGEVVELEDGSLLYEENPYIGFKLHALEEVSVNQGMFHFKKMDETQAAEYVLIALDGEFKDVEYSLNIELQDEEYIYALSPMFYQGQYKLDKNKVYSFSIRALAVSSNGLDSDVAQAINVKLLDTVSNITFDWKQYESGESNRFDTVVITWSAAVGISNPSYIYSINSSSVNEGVFNVVETNEYVIRSNNALNARNHNFRIRVMGSSQETGEGYFYLTSDYSSSVQLIGLAQPEVEIVDGVFTWKPVPFAEGYYIYYMKRTNQTLMTPDVFSQNKTWFSELITETSWKAPESFSDSLLNQAYYIAVVALNRDISRRYMPSAYGTTYITHTDENDITTENVFSPYTVLKAPDLFGNKNGVLMWHNMDYNINILGLSLSSGNNPFVYSSSIEDLFEILINIKIEDPSGRAMIREFYAVNLFHANLFNQAWFRAIASTFGFDVNYKYGIGNIDRFINEAFPSIKAGSNFISAMQTGNNINLLNSKYNHGKEFYVPQQVNAVISNSVLSWNEIVLPSNRAYENTSGKYMVISEDDQGKRIVVAQTNNLSINLIDFINDSTLKPGNHKLYVIVAGDGNYYLNGIAAPYISTFVLPQVSASLSRGILNWDSMQNTSGYLVKAHAGAEDYNFTQHMTVNTWDFAQLKEADAMNNTIEYNLTLQAVGNGKTILSGKETSFGKIIKLKTPDVSIVKGVFEWTDIENNLGYMINIAGDDNITFTIGTSITKYESIYKGFNSYNFRAIGSTTSVMGQGTTNFAISSYMEERINAVMLQSVKGTTTHDGQIMWQAMTDYSNTPISEFKLSFDQSNYKPPVLLTNNDFNVEIISGATYILYQLSQDYGAGLYKVYLQAHSEEIHIKDGISYAYLLGEIAGESSTEFEKLRSVEDVRVVDGVILWDNPNPYDTAFKVVLMQETQKFEFITYTNSFDATKLNQQDMIIYNQVSANLPVDVIVQVLGDNESLINSDEVRTNNFTKLKTITETDYIVDENQETGFIIRWYLAENQIGVSNYDYVISYIDNPALGVVKTLSSADSDLIVKGYDIDRRLHYGEIDAAHLLDRNSSTLIYMIAAIPLTNSNFISSSFSEPRSVSPPESLSGDFLFDVASQKILWAYGQEGSDVIFRIVDELVEINEQNEVVVVKTNVYLSQEKHFHPEEIGLHRIKIAVVLGTGKVSSSYVYFNHANAQGLINNPAFVEESTTEDQNFTIIDFNLFESGEGSIANPYVIANQTHFDNIRHRASKPEYLGNENRFTFVQTDNLIINALTTGIQNFAGNYDGQNFAINYHLISSKTSISQDVSLFESISQTGIVQNLVVYAKITLNHDVNVSSVRISALSIINSGTIQNVLIETFELINNITKPQVKYTYGAVAVQNSGTIYGVVSNAHIIFTGGAQQQSMLSADITVGGLVENNSGSIINSGSNANFKITARRITVAGIAVVSQLNASITRVFNKGNFDIVMNANNASTDSYVAGLVGRNLGVISSSYSSASTIKVDLMGTSNRLYVGGLVGNIQGANGSLINNSFTLTTNIYVLNSSSSTIDIGLIIGRTNAQDNNNQVRSYYMANSSISVLNGTIASFKYSVIVSAGWLVDQLNSYEQNAFEVIQDQVVHFWESEFELG